MKLEELTKLGIPEDTAKKVLALNEAEVSAETKKLTDKDAELTMAADRIRELTETVKKFDGVDVEKLKADLAEMSKKYDTDTAALKLDNALSKALATCGARDADIVGKLLDRSIIKLDDGKLIGVSEQLEKLKTDKAFLFGDDKPDPAKANPTGMFAQLGAQHDKPAGDGGAETLGAALAEHYNT
ncbi:MAG: hypothetical protein HFJ89_11480 [Oscillospiraceae bacterium]|jgi:hypothetical protein|nr:hypothetical protein [Oscillospiraceae bacterium]